MKITQSSPSRWRRVSPLAFSARVAANARDRRRFGGFVKEREALNCARNYYRDTVISGAMHWRH